MPKPKIKIGDRRGNLTIIGNDPSGTDRHRRYFVRCDCGREYAIAGGMFSEGRACKKCHTAGAKRKYGSHRVMQSYKLYTAWVSMRRRCDPNVEPRRNKRWAGRGITVCKEWSDSFLVFEAWSLANGYAKGLSLDRINNDGNYEPENCQWVTKSTNSKRCRALYDFVPRKTKFEPGITEWL